MSLPIPEYGKNDKETIRNLMDTVAKLRKELEYVLYHLDEQNIPMMKSVLGDIDGAYTAIEQNETAISLLATDLNGAEAQLVIQAGQITNLVTTTDGHSAQLVIQADQISSKVAKNGVISAINQSAESIEISASKINLYGITAVNDVLQIGYTSTDGEIRFKSRGGGSYVKLYSGGMFEAYDLNVDCSTMNVNGNLRVEQGIVASGSSQFDSHVSIDNLGGAALTTYGSVNFWGSTPRVDGVKVALSGSSQDLKFQVYDSRLEVFDGSTYIGRIAFV